MPVAEIGAELVETALTFAPWLVDVPVLGRICLLLAPHGGNDLKALEELQKQADQKKTDRKTRIDQNARYVLKASDAMKCVEDNLMSGGVMLAFGKAILNTLAGRGGLAAPDLLAEKIFTCIESKTLRQTSRRVITSERRYHRPSRGHGRGRTSFGPDQSTVPSLRGQVITPEAAAGTAE